MGSDLLLHPVSDSRVHGGTSRENGVGVQVLSDVNIALHDGVVSSLMDTRCLHTKKARLEESLRTSEPFVVNGDNLSIGELVRFLQGARVAGGLHFLLEVEGDVAELLLNIPDN